MELDDDKGPPDWQNMFPITKFSAMTLLNRGSLSQDFTVV